MWETIDAELGKKQGKGKGEVMKFYVKELTALGRPSEPEDVAKMVSFLASQDSNFVTGQTQLVDGGIVYT
jgi:NAD(P)-dependent dehydrogenase (short-subunit alcohol dehydrogenase family)